MRTSFFASSLLSAIVVTVTACGGDSTGPVQADSVSVVATASLDGWVSSAGLADANAGGPIVGDLSGSFPGSPYIRQFFSFSLSLPSGSVVDSARVRIYEALVAGDPFGNFGSVVVDHVVYGDTLDGTDYGVTALASNIGTLATGIEPLGYRSLAVTSSVGADVAAHRTRAQFRLRFANADGNNDGTNDFVSFGDAEVSCCATDSVPVLTIWYRH